MKKTLYISSFFGALWQTVATIAFTVEPVQKNVSLEFEPTYYTLDRKHAVYLTNEEITDIQHALNSCCLDTEEEFNIRIDTYFIKKVKSGCKKDCTCELIDKVLNDHFGKRIGDVILTLGVSKNL